MPFRWGTSGLISTGICARVQQWQKGQTPARAGRIHLSIACHPSYPHITLAHHSPLTRSRRCTVSAMSPRSTQSSPCRNTAAFIKLLLTVFFTRLSPLSPFGPPFSSHYCPRGILFVASPGKIHQEIYIFYMYSIFASSLSLSPPISRSFPSLSLSLSALLLKFSICASSSPSNRQPPYFARARRPPLSPALSLHH